MIKPSKLEIKQMDKNIQQTVCQRDRICLIDLPGCLVTPICGHHIIPRRYLQTRWNEKNLAGTCLHCHPWADQNPNESEPLLVRILIEKGVLNDITEWEQLRQSVGYKGAPLSSVVLRNISESIVSQNNDPNRRGPEAYLQDPILNKGHW